MLTAYLTLAELKEMKGSPIASHMDNSFRLILEGPQVVKRDGYMQLVTGEPHPFGNFAVLRDSIGLGSIESAVPGLVHTGAPSAVILLSEASVEVDAHLTAEGFLRVETMPGMAVALNQLAETSLPDGFEFVRVTRMQTGADWVTCASAGYGVPVPVTELFSVRALGGAEPSADAVVQWFAIKKGDQYVATSMMILNDGVAGIYWVATLEEERGKGLGAHVTAEPLRLAKQIGYKTGILQASEPGFPVYKRLGFEQLCGLPLYARMPE
jgi:GNAT superfamily N-acetyltransferase